MNIEDDSLPTRPSLLNRLKDPNDQTSWNEFFKSYSRIIYRLAARCGLADADAQEVVQETMIALTKQLPGFRYDPAIGSFRSWLRVITRRRVADLRRKQRPAPSDEAKHGSPPAIENLPDEGTSAFEGIWQEEWEAELAQLALARVRRQANSRHFQAFDLYVVKGWAVKDVAQAIGLPAPQIYLIKQRVSALVRKEAKRIAQGWEDAPPVSGDARRSLPVSPPV